MTPCRIVASALCSASSSTRILACPNSAAFLASSRRQRLATSGKYAQVVPPDAPDPLAALNNEEEAFIRAFSRALIIVPRALDADLLQGQGMSMSEYSVLMHLSEAPHRRTRMSDLAAACALSLSAITRIVTRLEQQNFVQRERCGADGRGWNAVLTDAGMERLRDAWPTHLASVRRRVFDHLQVVDLPTVTSALQSMAADPPGTGPHRSDTV
jgi:DNA-binding MarR family transcriptional regulator